MKIEPINLELSEHIKSILQLQEELQIKMDYSILGVPIQYLESHYCENIGEKCNKQCKYCKNEK